MSYRTGETGWRPLEPGAVIGLLCAAGVLFAARPGYPQSDVESFYRGRSISMLIGSATGGGYDAYARLLGRHMGKYVPGHPTIVPLNMPGASGNAAVQHLYTLPKDGAAFAAIQPGAITKPLYAGPGRIRYDYAQLVYLGSANTEVNLCWARLDAPVQSFQDMFSKQLIIGSTGEGDSTRDFSVAENNILGTKYRIILGYSGVRETVLAIERNEVQGICGVGVPAMMAQRPAWVAGGARMLVQQNIKGSAKLTAMGVPRTGDFAKTEEDRQVLGIIYAQQQFGRPFVMPPGGPPERIAALRSAFMQALADKDLLAEAAQMHLDIDPLSGDELQKIVERIYATPGPIIERAIKALVYRPPG